MPEVFATLRRLMEIFRPNEVEAGVRKALWLGAIAFDAVILTTATVEIFGTDGF